jgi:putative ABC transport system permease protein
MINLLRDLKCAVRGFIRHPGFALTALLTLALGIGASSAVYSVIDAVLISDLPYEDPHQLMALKNALLTYNLPFSYSKILDWKERAGSFIHLSAYSSSAGGASVAGGPQPEWLEGAEVTPGFFGALGLQPLDGRFFQPDEDRPGTNAVIVISYGLWKRRFQLDQSIVGRSLLLSGRPHTVIGVSPPGFEFPGRSEFWIPISFGKDRLLTGEPSYNVIGRLKPGITKEKAQSEINILVQRIKDERPGSWAIQKGIQVIPLLDELVDGSRKSLLLLSAAVASVLLIACSNVANLLLARSMKRRKEVSICVALGAGRITVIRRLLAESLLLSLIAAAIGLVAGSWFLTLLTKISPNAMPRLDGARLNLGVIAFCLAISLVTAFLVTIPPAWQSMQVDINESLKEGIAQDTALAKGGIRGALMVSGVALTMVILVGAGLLINSLIRIYRVDPGFNPAGVITFDVTLPEAGYSSTTQKAGFFQGLTDRIRLIPGTRYVGAINFLPLGTSGSWKGLYSVVGQPSTGTFEDQLALYYVVTPDYFAAMGIPLVQGRCFSNQDAQNSQPVAIIDGTIAKNRWPNESPVGKHLILPGESAPREIVGLVEGVKHLGLDVGTPNEIYMPYTQQNLGLRTVVIKTNADPATVFDSVRNEVQAMDKSLPIYAAKTMNQRLKDSTEGRRFIILLLSVFAGMAVLLAAVGIYSVMAYNVAYRVREIGIRMSLGGRRADVVKLFLGKGLRLTVYGVAMGIAGAAAFTRLMADMLFGITALDPVTLGIISTGILTVGLAATLLPTVRATRVDPAVALRQE